MHQRVCLLQRHWLLEGNFELSVEFCVAFTKCDLFILMLYRTVQNVPSRGKWEVPFVSHFSSSQTLPVGSFSCSHCFLSHLLFPYLPLIFNTSLPFPLSVSCSLYLPSFPRELHSLTFLPLILRVSASAHPGRSVHQRQALKLSGVFRHGAMPPTDWFWKRPRTLQLNAALH